MSLVKNSSTSLVRSESVSKPGKAMVAVGGGGIALTALSAVIPFVGVFGLSVAIALIGLYLILFK